MSENRIRLEPNHRRLRALVDGVVIADTTASVYLFETGHLPVYYLPKSHIRFDLLEHTDHSTHCPYKGDAEYWSIVVAIRESTTRCGAIPHRCPTHPTSPHTRRSTGTRSTTGSRRTRRCSSTPAIPTTASMHCGRRATSRSASTVRPSPTRRDRRCCSRPAYRPVTTSPS